MYELAGPDKIKYCPIITYLYNTNYGGNDNSTPEKREHRKQVHDEMVSYPRLSRLTELSG